MSPVNPSPPSKQSVTLLKQALAWHQQGRLPKALEMYQQVLRIDPHNFEALQGIGMLYGQLGRFEEALKFITNAGMVQPNDFAIHYNRGVALQELKRHEEALTSYDRALALKADFAQAYNNRGNVLKDLQRHEEALASYDKAIALQADYVSAHNNRGAILLLLQRYNEALASYDKALSLKSGDADTYYNRGNVLKALKRFDEALAAYDKTLLLKPEFAEAYNNRGNVLQELHRYEEALSSYDKLVSLKLDSATAHHNRGTALEALKRFDEALAAYDKTLLLKPEFAEAYNNRGNVLKDLRRYEEALSTYAKAIALNPNIVETHNNQGNIFVDLHRYYDALASYNKAIALNSDYPDAYYNKGLLKILLGDYKEGWLLYEWRWQTDQKDFVRNFKQPLWLGDRPLTGKTILLHAEQGLGDTLQMVRYVPMVEALGGKVILEVPASLVSLLDTLKGNFTLVTKGDTLPTFDLHCPLMSLPLAFKTRIDTIPSSIPYLAADPHKQSEWRERLGAKVGPRVGLAWSGNPQHKNDHNRSMALRTLEPLLHLDCEYHALQKEVRAEDKMSLAEFTHIRTHEYELNDFADTAALVAELDLVISVDSSVAHLAGALGKAVWILLPYNSDYRWLTARSDNPWYPTARLFRQRSLGDWEGVIEEISSALGHVHKHSNHIHLSTNP